MRGTATNESLKRLQEVANAQFGFFTTKQAIEAGFGEQHHGYHVQVGNWVREHRGIYRLAYYPATERPDLMLWYLWSRNRQEEPQGVYSHETALSLFGLSDILPARLHMTVPKKFRRSSEIPPILFLHYADLPEGSTEWAHGVRVTRPLDTIAGLLRENSISRDFLQQAMHQGIRRGLFLQGDLDQPRFDERTRQMLYELHQEVSK
jgi:hypothetical protein